MTALPEYQRLEATGLWRPSPEAQRRDVVVSVGEATLVMTDQGDRALAHWSLAALVRRNPGAHPAIYTPGPDATEDLELSDPEIIDAIERVRRAVERARPKPGRLRARIALASVAALALVALVLMPDTIIHHAARVAPEAARTQIAEDLLAQIERVAGPPCRSPQGDRALLRMKARLVGAGPGQLYVLRGGVISSASLPGGTILLNRTLVEDHETPEVAAGFVLAEVERARIEAPLLRLFDWTGMSSALRFLTTGHLSTDTLKSYAEHLMTSAGAPVPQQTMIAAFGRVGVRSTPYAYAMDITGEDTIDLIEADPVEPGTGMSILSDGDWVALQGICGG